MAGHQRDPLRPEGPGHASHRQYTPAFLRIYDPLVLGLYCRSVWRCPAPRLVRHYRRHLRHRHADVGPGTGYFLDQAHLPKDQALTLVDPNPHVLAHAARRLAHLRPVLVQADVCEPLPLDQRYGSVGLNLVWHCLPSDGKAAAFRHAASVLTDDGVLFGATVLGALQRHTFVSRPALRALNRRGVFDNLDDSAEALERALRRAFEQTEIHMAGAVAIFSASSPRAGVTDGSP